MNPNHDEHPLDPTMVAAATEWLMEAEEGFAPGRAEAFAAWCAQDSGHAAAVECVSRTLQLLERMPEHRVPEQELAAPPESPWSARRWLTATSGLAAALLLGLFLLSRFAADTAAPERRIVTEPESARLVALEDGSVVNVEGSSEVRVNLTSTERRVVLAVGEAQFAVAHDANRPFIVYVDDVAVRAVGTAFHVRRGPTGIEVSVMEGRVNVTRASTPALERPSLDAGERVYLPADGATIPALAPIERLDPTAWRADLAKQSKRIEFSDVPLREAAAQFNARNELQLIMGSRELGERKIAGSFRLDQVEAFARLLEQDGDVVLERTERRIILHLAR